MTTLLFNVNFELLADTMKTFLLCSALGLYIRFLISFVSNQKWLKNYSQFLVFALLPLTGYMITSVISNNIALSLGMVGALSIVRFRTPVKNPSELVIYFILITLFFTSLKNEIYSFYAHWIKTSIELYLRWHYKRL